MLQVGKKILRDHISCKWLQAVWCGQHAGGKECHPKKPSRGGPVQTGQVQGPPYGYRQSQAQIQVGWRMDWKQPWAEGIGGIVWQEAWHDHTSCAHRPESQPYPRLHQKKHGQQVKRGNSCEAPPRVSNPALGTPAIRRTWTCGSESRGRPWRWSQDWSNSPVRIGWKSRDCKQPKEEKALGRPYSNLTVLKIGLQERWGGVFYQGIYW